MISERVKRVLSAVSLALIVLLFATPLFASEADLVIPPLSAAQNQLLMIGFVICFLGMGFGYFMYAKVKKIPAHKSMLDVAEIIFQTCSTYLIQQGKLLFILFVFIGSCIFYYFGFLQHMGMKDVSPDPGLDRRRHPRVLRRGLVRHPHEHPGQCPHGLCLP